MSIFDKLTFDARDIKPVSIRIAHSTSEAVSSGKIAAGVVYRDDTFEILCEINEAFRFIPFWFVRQLVYATVKGNQVGKDLNDLEVERFQVAEHISIPNHPNYNDNHVSFEGRYLDKKNETVFVKDQITFYVFPFNDDMDEPQKTLTPCQIVFSGANMKVGRSLINHCHRARSLKQGANLCDFIYSMTLVREPVPNKPKSSYFKFGSAQIVGELPNFKNIKNIKNLFEQAASDVHRLIEQKALRFSHEQITQEPAKKQIPKAVQSRGNIPSSPAPTAPKKKKTVVDSMADNFTNKGSKVLSQDGIKSSYSIELADEDVDNFNLGKPI